ncbi:C40 family peptidase [Hydrocarboniphaga sp.]|uniref:C40 family peptidase n=1 Tax=Hydrocarboniphaga sp. TaxID=2033016 RepID=UPI003D09F2FF
MIRFLIAPLLALASWNACAAVAVVEPAAPTASPAAIAAVPAVEQKPSEVVLSSAESMLGMPYRLGGNAVSETDCSAMVRAAFTHVGIELPRSTSEQIKLGKKVDAKNLRPGDLMFYRWGKRRLHVAVYAGDGEIVHASPAAGQVIRTQLTKDWNRRLVQIRRVL